MLSLLYPQPLDVCEGLFIRSNNCIIFLFLIHFFFLLLLIIFSSTCQFIFKLFYDVPICIRDISVVALYFSILLCMFSSKRSNIGIFFFLNFFNLILTFRFHFLSEHKHFIFELQVDFLTNPFKFLSHFSLLFIFVFQ